MAAEEAAAAAEAAALAADPVLRLRKLAEGGAEPKALLAELRGVEVEGGQIGRTRVLYEVRPGVTPHASVRSPAPQGTGALDRQRGPTRAGTVQDALFLAIGLQGSRWREPATGSPT